jgi:hypothetical protein
VVLDMAEYELLQRIARDEERTADQQATFYVRSGLRASTPCPVPPGEASLGETTKVPTPT